MQFLNPLFPFLIDLKCPFNFENLEQSRKDITNRKSTGKGCWLMMMKGMLTILPQVVTHHQLRVLSSFEGNAAHP